MGAMLASYGPIATGLGVEARRMWRCLGPDGLGVLDSWLISEHPDTPMTLSLEDQRREVVVLQGSEGRNGAKVAETLERLKPECLVCIERPLPGWLFDVAKARGIRTVLLVNPEWLPRTAEWRDQVDTYVARNRFGMRCLDQAGLAGRTVQIRCPLDLDELGWPEARVPGRRRVVYVHGWGGVCERKGWPEVKWCLEQEPGLLEVYAQQRLEDVPPGTTVTYSVPDPRDLYRDADIVVLPSRHGSIELPILEAMACGCVVITSERPPMCEPVEEAYPDAADLLVKAPDSARIPINLGGKTWQSYPVDSQDLLAKIQRAVAMSDNHLTSLARRGLDYVQNAHGPAQWRALADLIGGKP